MLLLYDGSFEGLFTAIFECYNQKLKPDYILKEAHYQPGMFDELMKVETDTEKAQRVIAGLAKKISGSGVSRLFKCFHSEFSDIGFIIYEYVKLSFQSTVNIEKDYRQPAVLRVEQVVKKMNREIHRMHGFVRFQRTVDDIYAATITPDFDVIPFIGDHFKRRYSDQQWLIYDVKRDYGLYYNKRAVRVVRLENPAFSAKHKIMKAALSHEERAFREMWKTYFDATSIRERKNLRLHLQHLPRRYWKYLPEKFLTSQKDTGSTSL